MLLARYNHIRERLIALHDMIQYRQFSVWVAPVMFMDLEELRSRPMYTRDDSVADTQFYETQQLRSMTVTQLLEILPNMVNDTDIGYRDPNDVIPVLYEGLQEYIMLWCEIIKDVPELPHPTLEELKQLEDYAFTLFDMYRRIKPYLEDRERQNQNSVNAKLANMGLASFMGLFKQERIGAKASPEGLSFVSYLDMLKESMNWTGNTGTSPVGGQDSLLATDSNPDGLASWFMMK
ncbi:hypothetical protein NFI00_000070 [Salmonella enterica]|nr:hypothetical protein [Salmonella enterica]